MLAGTDDAEAAARALTAHAREVVVTLGAEGALWTDGAAVVRAPAVAAVRGADTTGAGDAFAAGLLAARLARRGAARRHSPRVARWPPRPSRAAARAERATGSACS